jgi:uncharacterized membrane protein YedE/YeeE/TusA-related sulfurtransferase
MQAGPLLYYITRPSIRKAPLSRNSTIKVAHMSMGNPWLWSCFYLGLGLLLGSVLYRSDFCMAGILRDVFLFRDFTLLRHLFLAVMLCTLFFLLLREAGILPSGQPQTFGRGSLLGVLGGVIFGIGMVLAGGCVLSTLYKMGGGNLAHGMAFAGIVIGSLLYAELYPLLSVAEQRMTFGDETTLMQLWPQGARTILWLAIGVTGALCVAWQRQGKWQVNAAAQSYLQPWRVAVILALLNLAAFAFSGWPLWVVGFFSPWGRGWPADAISSTSSADCRSSPFSPSFFSAACWWASGSVSVSCPKSSTGEPMDSKEIVEVVDLNILGQVCPACLLVVLKAINDHRESLRSGKSRLVVRTDHRDSTRTVPESARKMGYDVEIKKVETFYEISIGCKS